MENEEAKKALEELKSSVSKEVSADLRESLTKEVAGVVTKEVMTQVAAEMKDIRRENITEDEKAAKNWNATLKTFKDVYQKDIYGMGMKKDLDTSTTSSGAELIPEYFGNEVIRIAGKYGVARSNSRVIALPGKIFNLPGFGNVTAYRTDEKSAYTASGLSTDQVTFTAKKLTALVIATREAIEDANVDILKWIALLAGEAIAKKEDQWAFLGLGSGEGIFQTTGVPELTLSTGNTAFENVDFDDLLSALELVDDNVVDELKWIGSFSVFNKLRGKKDSNGQYIFQNPGAGMPNTIWGLRYLKSTVMPKTSDSTQAGTTFMGAYDPKYLMIGDRRKLELEFSKEATVTSSNGSTTINLFEKDYVAIKVSERLDIEVVEPTKAFVKITTSAS